MERESFEDAETAGYMNEHFVTIKVDREERPDVDAIYMEAVQAITGHGGWPMTVFLTPTASPSSAAPTSRRRRRGMPGFRMVLGVADAFSASARRSAAAPARRGRGSARSARVEPAPARRDGAPRPRRSSGCCAGADREHGGFGGAPKFPPASALELLLARGEQRGRSAHPRRDAAGGIYDQLGGGFHRYSVDAIWLVPHFEKMLYDNALLARVYLHAYQATGHERYRRICEETLD